jgi:hypothetical protein
LWETEYKSEEDLKQPMQNLVMVQIDLKGIWAQEIVENPRKSFPDDILTLNREMQSKI